MIKSAIFFVAAFIAGVAVAVPHIRVARQTDVETELGLPSNSTSIRANIVNTFTCDNKIYGYYADVDNECQVFHVCMPVVYADGKQDVLKWSFICPEETIFDQANLVCSRPEDAIPCEESANYLNVNENFGKIPEKN